MTDRSVDVAAILRVRASSADMAKQTASRYCGCHGGVMHVAREEYVHPCSEYQAADVQLFL
jgi:hypothetical protein